MTKQTLHQAVLALLMVVTLSQNSSSQMEYINCNSSCATTKVGGVNFGNRTGTTTGQWGLSNIGYEGLASESFVITDSVAYQFTDGDLEATGGGTYTIVDDPSSVNGPDGTPLEASGGGGTLLFATNDTEPFAYYEIEGLEPGGQYCVQLKMRNPQTNTTCNNQLWTRAEFRSLSGINISGGGLSNGTWRLEEGADGCNETQGGWDGNNQTNGIAKQGMVSTFEINFTLGQNPNNSGDDGFRIYFRTNSFQPNNVMGIDGIEVFGCITQEIHSSNGDEICEATPTTLTAMGIGSETDVYTWREGGANGTVLPYTSRSFEVIPNGETTYWVENQRTGVSLTKTISPVNCCGPTGLFTIPKVCTNIDANGLLDESVWNVAPWQDMDASNAFGISAAGDCIKAVETHDAQIAQWRAVYDDDNAYFFIRTYDDNPRNAGTDPWFQDGVEIYIDRDNNPLQYGYAWSGDGQPATVFGSGPDKGSHVIRQYAGYWDLEVAIPLAGNSLDFTDEFIRMELGINQARDGETCRSSQIFSWEPQNHYLNVNEYHVSTLSDCASVIATEESVCNGGSTTLSTQLMTENTGLDYLWEMSTDGGNNWTTVAGETAAQAVVSPTVETQYRATYDGVPTCPITITVGDLDISAGPATSAYCTGETMELVGVTTETSATWGWRKGASFATSVFVPGYNLSSDPAIKTLSKTFETGDDGTYYFVVENGGCEGQVSVEVTGSPLPEITDTTSAERCGEGTVELTAAASSGTLNWYDQAVDGVALDTGSPFTTPSISATQIYYVEAVDGSCVSDRLPVRAAVLELPVAVLPEDYSICLANPTTTITETSGQAVSWAWSASPDDAAEITVTLTGETTFIVTITDAQGCMDTENVTVQMDSELSPSISGITEFCLGQSTTLTVSGGATYLWDDGNMDNPRTITPTDDIAYSVTASDAGGCSGDAQVIIVVNDLPVPAIDESGASICQGETGVLLASGGVSYNWSNNTAQAELLDSPAQTTNYIVTVTDANNCSATANADIVVNPAPNVTASDFESTCVEGEMVNLDTGEPVGGTYSGQGVNGALFNPAGLAAGIYTITYSYTDAQSQCSNQTTAEVEIVAAPTVNITAVDPVCQGESAVLDTDQDNGTFLWSDGSAAPTLAVTPDQNTTYSVTFTDAVGCAGTAATQVEVIPVPQVDFTAGLGGCAPITVEFHDGTVPSGVTYNYVWDFGDPTSDDNTLATTSPVVTHEYLNAGEYDVTLWVETGVGACESVHTIVSAVVATDVPVADFEYTPELPTTFEPEVTLTNASSGDVAEWNWLIMEPGQPDVTLNGAVVVHEMVTSSSVPVQLEVVTAAGCVDTITKWIDIQPIFTFYAPAAFSPDGNGVNDNFEIFAEGISDEDYSISIFNRWGDMIFESETFGDFWNGNRDNGSEEVPIGVYTWLVRFADMDGEAYERNGKVTVIR